MVVSVGIGSMGNSNFLLSCVFEKEILYFLIFMECVTILATEKKKRKKKCFKSPFVLTLVEHFR